MPRLNQAVIAPPALWLCASALLAGCGGGGGQSPLSPTVEGAGILPPPLAHPGGGTIASVERGELLSIPGGYTLEVTTAPLAARLTPWREIQGIQGNLYDLDIDNFLKGDTITITGVRTDTEANVIIDYAIKHPFPAPNFNNPITGLNRADLGFTGRVLFLTDVPSRDLPARTFFGNVVANTSAVLNADAYMDPGDLLANSTDFNATAFPYKLVVDEAKNGTGNRVGITNGGNPRGNYDPANGGWQRANIGPNRNGWTGYDFLHQGQTARSQLTLAQEAVANNAATLDIAIFIKYTDPRGVGGKTARMPFEPPDPTLFAYRLPNGALDASQIFVSGATYQRVNISQTAASTADLSVKVRDWDARAMETTQAMIQMEPDLSKVNIGTSGTPTLALSIPALAATTVNLTAGSESGIPGDEITYTGTLTNTLGTAAPGTTQYGLFRAVDPEDSAPNRNTYHFGVDPVTVLPDAARATRVVTYQALRAQIQSSNVAPSCGALGINGPSTIGAGGSFTVDLAAAADANDDDLTIGFRYIGPTSSSSSGITLTDTQRAGEGMFNPFTDVRLSTRLIPPTTPGNYTLEVTLDDAEADPVTCTDTFTVVANQSASCGGTGINETGPFPTPVNFTLDLSTIADADSGTVTLRFSYTGPESDISSDLLIPVASLPTETAFNPFSDPRLVFPLVRPTTAGDYQFLVQVNDGQAGTSCGPFEFTVEGTPNLPPDCGTLAAQFPKTIAPSGTFTLDLSGNSDPDSNSLTFSFAYAGPGGTSNSGPITFTLAQLAGETAFNPFTDSRLAPRLVSPTSTGDYNLTVTVSDGVNQVDCGPFGFTVEGAPNAPPSCGTIGINGTGSIPADGEFTVDLSSATDPDSSTLTIGFSYTGPESSTSSTFSIAVPDLGAETEFNPFRDARLTTPMDRPQSEGTYQLAVSLDDGANQVTCGPFTFMVEGAAGPPDCGAGISVSDNNFNEGETVDFTVDLSSITDPDSLTAMVTVRYAGPSNSSTSTVTVPYPLPAAVNPFLDTQFPTPLDRPTLVGTYILTAAIEDADGNSTECMTTFTINPSGTPDPVTDIDVEVNYTEGADEGRVVDVTDTLTITWAEDNAPEYAVYADLAPHVDLDDPEFDPTVYRPDAPEMTDDFVLIGTTTTNSFTGFSIDAARGWFAAHIVVRARATAGDPGSELTDSEGAYVGILADPEVEATFNPFWGIQANTPDDPVEFALVEGAELNGTWLGFTNLQPGSLAGLASLNLPIPLENNLDRAILNVNFFTTDWETDEEQGEVGGVFQPEFADALWMPTLDPGEPYTLIDEDIAVYFNGVPTDRNNVHEEAVGTTGWLFRRYDGFSVIGTGALSSNGYSFANEVNTTELVGWDEASYIFD